MRFSLTVTYWQHLGTNQELPVNANAAVQHMGGNPQGKCSESTPQGKCSESTPQGKCSLD